MEQFQEDKERRSFQEAESLCEYRFRRLGHCWHLYTPEDFEIIFSNDDEFRAGMTLFALCALSFPSIKVLAFEWMNNHLHATLAGEEKEIMLFFKKLSRLLERYLQSQGRSISLRSWTCQLRLISDLKDIRSVIAYNNRNGFLVDEMETPYTYPWGANRFFFNHYALKEHVRSEARLKIRDIWKCFHTREFDKNAGLAMIDGYVSPLECCHVQEAESLFRDAHHYFHAISRDTDGQRRAAKEFGDRIMYTDNELYTVVVNLCRTLYGVAAPSMLPKDGKMDIARRMHFDYNASDKQIIRFLKMEPGLLRELFR